MRSRAAGWLLTTLLGAPLALIGWRLVAPGPLAPSQAPAPRATPETPVQQPVQSPARGEQRRPRVEHPAAPEQPARPTPIRWASEVQANQADRIERAIQRCVARRDLDGLRELAAASALQSDHRHAVAALRQATRLAPYDRRLSFDLGAQLMRLGEWSDAVASLREALREEGDWTTRAWHNLGVALVALGRLHEAREAWDEILRRRPDDLEALAQRGELLLDLQDWQAAEADFAAALLQDAENEYIRLNRGLALWRLGRLEQAQQETQAVLARRPRHVPALNRLAQLAWARALADDDSRDEQRRLTIEACERSLTAQPGQPDIQDLLELARAPAEDWP
jgi:tetratricopeptide (TPR) repeat protein